ncbi:hypothetical protein [Shewanella sp. NIFS-20-20]|uniref:hypothetical protein n=1 Tax=Shewanella sp. NIFS-20-20 TaxID=2853806 RepID=UPI001C494575|nr:hypothetical protein [Shewanella sp. NIFS-20-20]MBV7314394.1 hypothetical protein [Shewanella sp. NIFS-20-20]
MNTSRWFLGVSLSSALVGCGFVGETDKQQLEQVWLAQHQEVQQAIEDIRAQGLEMVAQTAQAGSVSACVAEALAESPVGALASVEGALAESANITELLASLQTAMSEELSIETVSNLLQQGADAATYAKDLIAEQGLEQALATLSQMQQATSELTDQDLGAHLQALVLACEAN